MTQDGERFETTVDLDGFREIFKAQQGAYTRKLGIGCAVIGVPCTVLGFAMLMDEPSLEALGAVAIFLFVAVLGMVMTVNPAFMLTFRKPVVFQWFYLHGIEDPNEVPFSSLQTSYATTIGAWGFTIDSATAHMNVPWTMLDKKPISTATGTVFRAADGKNSSVVYNMLGINWAFRDESAGTFALLLPKAYLATNPGAVNEVRSRIEHMNAQFRGRKAIATDVEREAVSAWVDESRTSTGTDDEANGVAAGDGDDLDGPEVFSGGADGSTARATTH